MDKKILIVITTAFVPYGGLATVMMNYYRAMDKSGLKIDFASTNEPPKELLNELRENGSNYYCLGNRKKRLPQYLNCLKKLLKAEKYDVIHVNGNSTTMAIELSMACKCGVQMRIAHVHTTKSMIHNLFRKQFIKSYTFALAVSSEAGDLLYQDRPYIVLKNAIDTDKYRFDADIREKYRIQLKLQDSFVIGHIGKLYEAKNHSFLLNTFAEIRKKREDAKLLLVGDGHLRDALVKQCETLGITDAVVFAGMRSDVAQMLQAMDLFVFPSLYEGFPLAMLEAQASGLPCLVSDNVTKEAKCTSNVVYRNLGDGAEAWAKTAIELNERSIDRIAAADGVKKNGFDIYQEAFKLRDIYLRVF